MKTKIHLLIFAGLLVLSSCASNKDNRSRDKYQNFVVEQQLDRVSKIIQFRMMGWQSLDHQFFILNASRSRDFLIEVMGYCPDLQYSHSLRLVQSMSSSLQSKFDSVIVDSEPSQKCTIKNIYKLSEAQKDLLVSGDLKSSLTVKKVN